MPPVAVVLCGGLGTRFRAVSDKPKVLAQFRNKPFLLYIISYLKKEGVENIIFSAGYKADLIKSAFDDFSNELVALNIELFIEDSPLGTGGAVKKVFEKYNLPRAFVINGDTLWSSNINHFSDDYHSKKNILYCSWVDDNTRYGVPNFRAGTIEIVRTDGCKSDNQNWVLDGRFILNNSIFNKIKNPVFSLEDIFTKSLNDQNTIIRHSKGSFIDFGVPKDYSRMQRVDAS